MKKILSIISSPRRGQSASTRLASAVIARLMEAHPDAVVETLDLTHPPIPQVSFPQTTSFRKSPDALDAEDLKNVEISLQMLGQLKESDIIVIGAPMYNFGISTFLKSWIDQICRAGHTFSYTETGFKGLVTGKKVYLAISTGGIYSEPPMKAYDFVTPYLTATLGFMGMTDITVFRVEGVDIPGMQDAAWEKALNSIRMDEAVDAIAS